MWMADLLYFRLGGEVLPGKGTVVVGLYSGELSTV